MGDIMAMQQPRNAMLGGKGPCDRIEMASDADLTRDGIKL
jgi:hypothetical protein